MTLLAWNYKTSCLRAKNHTIRSYHNEEAGNQISNSLRYLTLRMKNFLFHRKRGYIKLEEEREPELPLKSNKGVNATKEIKGVKVTSTIPLSDQAALAVTDDEDASRFLDSTTNFSRRRALSQSEMETDVQNLLLSLTVENMKYAGMF